MKNIGDYSKNPSIKNEMILKQWEDECDSISSMDIDFDDTKEDKVIIQYEMILWLEMKRTIYLNII